ncbi:MULTISPECIES: hypothetical protein [Bradyrhizobium]|uniref:hypothetical protein n=1 Tax=Bradyrhizobium elkanii TaxID=29448 RepID=UPI0027148D71|nr:hypothetical protein [Bradyrhizobium elkanii]WLA44981.1 hypothetical protein QIH80_23875 [Bradyrhizobium elkanii]WLB84890.1 hypothetical protein QIH83_21020 [Bradyrhizobium elkanii]
MSDHFKKEAKRLVKHAIQRAGGQHAVSDLTGVDTSQLSRWGNEDDDERHITLYRAMELDEAAGDAILKGWARRRGAEVVFRDQDHESADKISTSWQLTRLKRTATSCRWRMKPRQMAYAQISRSASLAQKRRRTTRRQTGYSPL